MSEENKPGAPEESKADKFKRLAEPRVDGALKRIKILGNLSSSSYEYNHDQVEKMFAALRGAIDEIEKKFQKGLNRKGFNDEGKFHL